MFRMLGTRMIRSFAIPFSRFSCASRSRIAVLAAGLLAAGAGTASEAGSFNRQAAPSAPPALGEAAARYRSLLDDMTRFTSLSYKSMQDVRSTRTALSKYKTQDVVRGWFSHHAMLVAAQPEFRSEITRLSQSLGRDAFLARITPDPSFLRTNPVVLRTVKVVMDEINSGTSKMAAMKELVVSRAGYFAKARTGDAPATSISTPAELVAKYDRTGYYSPMTAPAKAHPMLDRVLVLAARLTIDAAGGENLQSTMDLTTEGSMKRCVRFSRLNFNQCVAATRFPEEEAFCVGRHGVGELGECWRWMLGG